ncbi:MAG: D-alanyl-D-alanine carboxypeptidase/D-alanyl-D-alanine-endopeptidase [Saprospiraceae bacterium]
MTNCSMIPVINIKMTGKYLLFAALFMCSFAGYGQTKKPAKSFKTLNSLVEESPVFAKSFTGFVLFDAEDKRMIYNKNGDLYFTPASNIKIFTLYTAWKVLADSIPAFYYKEQGDSLIIWGSGNPLFLNPDFFPDSTAFSFLKSHKGSLYFSPANYKDERFGSGWAWDDYGDYYQVEKSPFPIYGNMAAVRKSGNGFEVFPEFFRQRLVYNKDLPNERAILRREEYRNFIEYNATAGSANRLDRQIPYQCSPEMIANLLGDTLGKEVGLLEKFSLPQKFKTLHVKASPALYRRMMQESDNFLAEQLLLTSSGKVFGVMNTAKMIDYAKRKFFSEMPKEPFWTDGSGLSRYNMATPGSVVQALFQLYSDVPADRLFAMMPAGGVSGTIKAWYAGDKDEDPYVFAKTGTLRHVHCLSGYLCAKSGKTMIFSFMHNNLSVPADDVRKEMEKVLEWIYANY